MIHGCVVVGADRSRPSWLEEAEDGIPEKGHSEMSLDSLRPLNETSTNPGQHPAQDRLLEYARGMTAIGNMLEDLNMAIEGCCEAELYDDPQDPLRRAAKLVDELPRIIAEGRRFAAGERQATPPDPALALELREGADRLSRVSPKMVATLAHHLAIQARRSSERQGSTPYHGR
jgi:hypothetical protein